MKKEKRKKLKIRRRKERIHKKMRNIAIVSNKPRLVVFRSNKHIYGQVIDDKKGVTVVSASSLELKDKKKKAEVAYEVGKLLGERALKSGIKEVVFDRGQYKYHGRVKALAEGARSAGLVF